jgi:putative addiction module killer protein
MKVQYYITKDGKKPVIEWLERLRDKQAKAAILKRIARIELNLLGDLKSVRDGIFELRIDVGAGYRVYCAQSGPDVILLLCGGDKGNRKGQDNDIARAKEYRADFDKRNK